MGLCPSVCNKQHLLLSSAFTSELFHLFPKNKMATSRLHVGLDEGGRVGSKTTRIQPPGGMSHINTADVMPAATPADVKQFNRVLKPPGGGSSAESVFSDGASVASSSSNVSMASSPNESRD